VLRREIVAFDDARQAEAELRRSLQPGRMRTVNLAQRGF